MAVTPAGTPYVESSDNVADYPGVSLALANHIDGLDGGKVLQVVRATDATSRNTSSTTFVDVTGMAVTITPQKSSSRLIIAAIFAGQIGGTGQNASFRITNASNVSLSGAELAEVFGSLNQAFPINFWGYVETGSTSAATFKLRFRSSNVGNQAYVNNNGSTGQMYAIEVAA